MERREVVILFYFIPSEDETVYRFRIEDRVVEGLKIVVFYSNPTMEIAGLFVQLRNLGIDGNDGVGELKQIG